MRDWEHKITLTQPGTRWFASEAGCGDGQRVEVTVHECPPSMEECPEIRLGKAKGKKTVLTTVFAFNACQCYQHCENLGNSGAGDFTAKKSKCRCFDQLAKAPKWGKGGTNLFIF